MVRALLVEDEFYIREALKRMINWSAEGYEIIGEAENGAQALKKVEEYRPDLILLDINLPDMDGFGLITQLKKEGLSPYIIIITGYDAFEYAKKAISFDVMEYLLKPVIPMELSHAVRKVREKILAEEKEQHAIDRLTNDLCRLAPLVDAEKLRSGEETEGIRENNSALVKKVKRFVNENLSNEELNVGYVSQKLFLNISYLSHVFKKSTNQGLREYIFSQRMNHAYDLVMNTDRGLEEIAGAVGFKDAVYFGKCFKKHFGASISGIRKIQDKYKK